MLNVIVEPVVHRILASDGEAAAWVSLVALILTDTSFDSEAVHDRDWDLVIAKDEWLNQATCGWNIIYCSRFAWSYFHLIKSFFIIQIYFSSFRSIVAIYELI